MAKAKLGHDGSEHDLHGQGVLLAGLRHECGERILASGCPRDNGGHLPDDVVVGQLIQGFAHYLSRLAGRVAPP